MLHSFAKRKDGAAPVTGLILDSKGNYYGTTYAGGASGYGTVFKLTSLGREKVLYSFSGGTDGAGPSAGLLLDAQGNLYGTTYTGGASGRGTVFKLTPAGEETVLYSFCSKSNCKDGQFPVSGLIVDAKGNLYGTTSWGGAYGVGTVFKLNRWGKESVLHSFCRKGGICVDGQLPLAGLIFDAAGNLYGTTSEGGANGIGAVFQVSSSGKETVLYSFRGVMDGTNPIADLVFDSEGNLYGTTLEGGMWSQGTVFELAPSGMEIVLYAFVGATQGGTDGADPYGGVVFDSQGNLYGTTSAGGASGNGTVFELTPSGIETVLYSFCSQANCTDGQSPVAGLVFDASGNLYGTTSMGGTADNGTVFKLVP